MLDRGERIYKWGLGRRGEEGGGDHELFKIPDLKLDNSIPADGHANEHSRDVTNARDCREMQIKLPFYCH